MTPPGGAHASGEQAAETPAPSARRSGTAPAIGTAVLCAAFAVAVFVPPGRDWLNGHIAAAVLSAPALAIVAVACAVMAIRAGNAPRARPAGVVILWAIALFAAVFAVSAAIDGPWGSRRWFAALAPIVRLRSLFVVAASSALLMASVSRRGIRRREFILDFICLCGTIEAVLVLLECALWRMGFCDAVAALPWKTAMFRVHDGVGFVPGSLRPTGTFGNPNITAAILAATFAILLDRALPRHGQRRIRWGAYALATVAVLAVAAARSRAAYVGCAVAAAVAPATRHHPNARRALLLSLALLAILGVASRRRIGSVRVTDQPAIQARLGVWNAAASIWTTRPVTGIGIGRFPDAYAELPEVDDRTEHIFPDAHSAWWTILAEMGLAGFVPIVVATLAAVGCAVRDGRRMFPRQGATETAAGSAAGIAAAVAALSVCFLFDNLVVSPAAAILFWILVGATLTANR